MRACAALVVFMFVGSALAAPPILRVGVCQPILLHGVNGQLPESLGPVGIAAEQLEALLKTKQRPMPSTRVDLQSPPAHGRFVEVPPEGADGWPGYQYLAQPGYSGKDEFVVEVSLPAGRVELVYHTQVVIGESSECDHPVRWAVDRVW